MPYHWAPEPTREATDLCLTLWPHRSLPRKGFVIFIAITASLVCVPLLALIGSLALWVLLPFLLIMLGAVWTGINKSYRDGEIVETLHITETQVSLERIDHKNGRQEWQANPHWVALKKYETGGPVKHYLTLRGNGREVELGAFLSEEERIALYHDLRARLPFHP